MAWEEQGSERGPAAAGALQQQRSASSRRRRRPGEAPASPSYNSSTSSSGSSGGFDGACGGVGAWEGAAPGVASMWVPGCRAAGSSSSDGTGLRRPPARRQQGIEGAHVLRNPGRSRTAGPPGDGVLAGGGRMVLGLLALLLLLHAHSGALAFSPHHPRQRGPPPSGAPSPQPPQSPSTAPPPSTTAAASAAAAYGGAFAPFPSPAAPAPPQRRPAAAVPPPALQSLQQQQARPRATPVTPPIRGREAAAAAEEAPVPKQALTGAGAVEAALAAAGAWAGTWTGRRASLALHELACVATSGRVVASLLADPRFGRLLERLKALALSTPSTSDELTILSPLDVATALQALGRLAGHAPPSGVHNDAISTATSLAGALLERAAAMQASLSGRDLSAALHAAGKLAAAGLLPGTTGQASLRLLASEALSPHRLQSSSSTRALTPRDAAQALTGIAGLGAQQLLEEIMAPAALIAGAAEALAAMVARRGGEWGAQEIVGLAEGAAALAGALPSIKERVDVERAWLALEGLGQALVGRAGGGAAVRGPVKGTRDGAGVVRLWRPRDRRRVAAALGALLQPAPLAAPTPAAAVTASSSTTAGAPERWLLRARVRGAPTPAALQALLLLHDHDRPPPSSAAPLDGVALAMGVQRLGRLCAGRRREQASARAWLLPHLLTPAATAAVAGMDGRALASLADGLAMLQGAGRGVEAPLAAAVDAAMARALLPPASPSQAEAEAEALLPAWLLAPDAARLYPALVKLGYGATTNPHRQRLLGLAHRRAAAGAATLPLSVVGRLLHAMATATATAGPGDTASSAAVASAALLRRGAALLASPSGAAKDVANLVAAAGALAEADSRASNEPVLAEPLAALARAASAWEARRPLPEGGMSALDLAKLLGGLSRLLRRGEAAVAAPRWVARARALLPDARVRALGGVARALGAVVAGSGDREALLAFVADARRQLPGLVAAAAAASAGVEAGIEGAREAEAEATAALAALEAAAGSAEERRVF